MKKSLKFILLFLLIIPIWVKADMSAPMIKGYDAIITNPNGVDCDGTIIPYDTKIEVEHEEVNERAYIEYNGSHCGISLNDIKPYNSVYDLNDAVKLEKTLKALVVAKNGTKLYKGPSTVYDEIGVIPYDTELNYSYVTSEWENSVNEHWLYVEYNGLKGWVGTITGEVVFDTNSKIFIVEDAKFYNVDEQVVATIPKFTELNGIYTYNAYMRDKYYLTYNGVKGYIDATTGSKLEREKTVVATSEAKMYGKLFEWEEEKVIATIPKGTELKYKYYNSRYKYNIYTSYNGKVGWVSIDEFDYDDENNNNEDTNPESENQKPNEDNNLGQNNKNEDNNVVEQSNKFGIRDIVILCVGIAMVSSLTTTVIILLVNKKGKKEENNNK